MMQRLYCGHWHKAISRCPIHNSIGGFREHCRSRSSLPSIASRSRPSQVRKQSKNRLCRTQKLELRPGPKAASHAEPGPGAQVARGSPTSAAKALTVAPTALVTAYAAKGQPEP